MIIGSWSPGTSGFTVIATIVGIGVFLLLVIAITILIVVAVVALRLKKSHVDNCHTAAGELLSCRSA